MTGACHKSARRAYARGAGDQHRGRTRTQRLGQLLAGRRPGAAVASPSSVAPSVDAPVEKPRASPRRSAPPPLQAGRVDVAAPVDARVEQPRESPRRSALPPGRAEPESFAPLVDAPVGPTRGIPAIRAASATSGGIGILRSPRRRSRGGARGFHRRLAVPRSAAAAGTCDGDPRSPACVWPGHAGLSQRTDPATRPSFRPAGPSPESGAPASAGTGFRGRRTKKLSTTRKATARSKASRTPNRTIPWTRDPSI